MSPLPPSPTNVSSSSASSTAAFSSACWPRVRMMARTQPVSRCWWAPTRTFSSAVMPLKRRMFWYVREQAQVGDLVGGSSWMGVPPSRMLPSSMR